MHFQTCIISFTSIFQFQIYNLTQINQYTQAQQYNTIRFSSICKLINSRENTHQAKQTNISECIMNKQQVVSHRMKLGKYMQQNKLRALFHQLTKLLLLKQPQNPIQFLIDYLDRRNSRQIVCIQGYHDQKRIKLAKNISIKFNYKLIQLSQLFKGVHDYHAMNDKQINQKVLSELVKVQSVYKGVIISGYPNNIVQTNFIQKSGILPERYFLMQNDEIEIEKLYQNKYQGNIELMIKRNRLERKQLRRILGELGDELPANIELATDVVASTLGVKAHKKTMPYDSLRVSVLYPPFLKPSASSIFVNTFCLNPISLNQTLKKLSHKQNFVNNVESYIRKHKEIPKEIQLAMIETMAKSAASRNKGYVLYGWPQSKDRIPFFKQHFLNPHVIFIFDQSQQDSIQQFLDLNSDNPDLFFVNQKPTKQQYIKLYHQFQQVVDELKGKNNVHIFQSNHKSDHITTTFLSLIENTKIYS